MRLLEWQAKQLFKEHGIPVPESMVVSTKEELQKCQYPAMIKAQIPIGGRGKAGGIKLANHGNEAVEIFEKYQNSDIRGYNTQTVLVEEPVKTSQEIYLSLLFDKQTNNSIIVASPMGGMDIEQVAKNNPEKIIKIQLDYFLGVQDFMVRYLAKYLGLAGTKELKKAIQGLFEILVEKNATLVEINPLAMTEKGLLALDGKIEIDNKAESQNPEFYQQIRTQQKYRLNKVTSTAEKMAKENGVKFVQLDGNVGMLTDGAGTGMLTLDLVNDEGGRPANFCELGGLANPESVCKAIKVVLANPSVKVLLISLIGGMTRMDEMADGIAMYVREKGMTVPFVVRMCGTKEDEGRSILQQVGLSTFYSLTSAVKEAVSLAGK